MTHDIFIRHPREYTILGITCVIDAMVGDEFQHAYGGSFREMISVVEDGQYYHYQIDKERERVSTFFLNKVESGEVQLEEVYDTFVEEVEKYQSHIDRDLKSYTKSIILEFFRYYKELIPIAYAGMDSADFVAVLSESNREGYLDWVTRVRIAGEVIYKNGEMDFLPRYCTWLAGELDGSYTGKELEYLTYFEMMQYLEEGTPLPSSKNLQQRMKSCYMSQTGSGEYELLVGEDAVKKVIDRKLVNMDDDALVGITELQGRVAFEGIARGKAHIIRARKDMEGFEDGDIVVSPMTDPSYLPVMKRAAAFVTNEGGTLCHAAIVARELQKPCVIATKHATHIFRNGDMLEVDANTGVVKKV